MKNDLKEEKERFDIELATKDPILEEELEKSLLNQNEQKEEINISRDLNNLTYSRLKLGQQVYSHIYSKLSRLKTEKIQERASQLRVV